MTGVNDEAPTLPARAAESLRTALGIDHIDLCAVLGSGWSAQLGERIAAVPLAEVPGFLPPVVPGHGGDAVAVRFPGGAIGLVLTGRTHLYEGHGPEPVVHGVRTAAALGARVLVLTNAAGGLDPSWRPGTPVLIRDHINLTGTSPLVGPSFVDLTDAWSPRLRALAHEVEPHLPEGVYVQFRGPQYETPAEVQMASAIGGDLVGMSTALEAVAAREAGLEVLGLSLVTNVAAGLSAQPLSHEEVLTAGREAAARVSALLDSIVDRVAGTLA